METNLILGRKVKGIELALCDCANCPDTRSALHQLRKVIQFVDPRPNDPSRPEHYPEKRHSEPDGSIIVPISIIHPALGRDCKLFSVGWQIGVASLTYLAKSYSVCISQTNSSESTTLEEMVTGMVNLTRVLSPVLGTSYGWVDATGNRHRPCNIKRFGDVTHWYFANIFSASLVRDAPTGFFDGFPAHERITISDGSLLLTSAPSFSEWVFSPSPRIVSYLKEHAPKIAIFNR